MPVPCHSFREARNSRVPNVIQKSPRTQGAPQLGRHSASNAWICLPESEIYAISPILLPILLGLVVAAKRKRIPDRSM